MNIDIYSLRPINRTAAEVTSQKGVFNEDNGASPHEINEQRMKMLANRREELADFLGIKTKAQKRNYRGRICKDPSYISKHKYPTLLAEWYRIGQESFRITEHLRLLKTKEPK